ncbi:MAG: thioredoxin family protein [Bacteroidota bacterium]
MKPFRFTVYLAVLSIIFSCSLQSQTPAADQGEKGIKFEHSTWSGILEKARQEGKPVFLDAFASWCSPCKWMAKNIFTNDTVAQFYNANFISAKIDMEKGEGLEIAKKYGVRAYPTMLYISPEGEMIHRTCGSVPAQEFIQNGKNALDPEKQLSVYMKSFGDGNKDAAFTLNYLKALDGACMEYQAEMAKYFEKQNTETLISRPNWQIISSYLQDVNSGAFRYMVSNKDKFASLYTADSVNMVMSRIYQASLYELVRKKDMAGYEALQKRIMAEAGTAAPAIILSSDMKLYKKTKDWKKYADAAEKLIDKTGVQDAELMNEAAWTLYENSDDKQLLLKAEKWAQKGVELNDSYALNDTYAAVLYKIGKKDAARAAAEKAIQLGKKTGEDTKETELLLEKITAKK